eukprot:m.345586 g.345586  ORF g.345586 m.345586 type:complete len:129 (+) comp16560_c1_seq3:553-939(+)
MPPSVAVQKDPVRTSRTGGTSDGVVDIGSGEITQERVRGRWTIGEAGGVYIGEFVPSLTGEPRLIFSRSCASFTRAPEFARGENEHARIRVSRYRDASSGDGSPLLQISCVHHASHNFRGGFSGILGR